MVELLPGAGMIESSEKWQSQSLNFVWGMGDLDVFYFNAVAAKGTFITSIS